MSAHWVIFTDLDGTLLERESYSYAPARQALELIRQQNIPLILNSSKTVAEILSLRTELGNQHPFVVENGAAVIVPNAGFDPIQHIGPVEPLETPSGVDSIDSYHIRRFSQPHKSILSILSLARAAGFKFAGFSDWSSAELAAISGLSVHQAALAKQRQGSEPVLFEGDPEGFTAFLAAHDLRVVQGGRFLHVMGQYDKADGVNWLLELYRKKYAPAAIKSVALGDSHNDQGMLNAVDVPVVIKSPHSENIILEYPQRALFSTYEGPHGWNEQLLKLLLKEPPPN